MLGMLVPLSRISQEGTDSESRKKNKNKRFFLLSSLILPASSNKISRIQPPEGPHWFAGASERLPLWGARQCNREGLGNSHAGYLHWWQRNGLHRTKKWHSRYYYTYLYINCDHIAVFDLYPMVEIVGGRMLGCPTFNPCHPCPNLVDMRYIEIHYRSLYTMPPCLLLSLKTPFALREVWLQDWLVFGIRDSIAIFKGKLPLEWVYSMSLPTSDHPPQ